MSKFTEQYQKDRGKPQQSGETEFQKLYKNDRGEKIEESDYEKMRRIKLRIQQLKNKKWLDSLRTEPEQ
jgi:hypothetical protein